MDLFNVDGVSVLQDKKRSGDQLPNSEEGFNQTVHLKMAKMVNLYYLYFTTIKTCFSSQKEKYYKSDLADLQNSKWNFRK